jgi:hypothetical protein
VPNTLSIYPVKQRFTLDGSAELEQELELLCQRVRQAVLKFVPREKLEALVLGGGYGRGQGGVLQTEDGGEAPYNDLEFYAFLRGSYLANARRFRAGFQQLEQDLSHAAGLHVEFKVDSLEKLRVGPVSIFSYDLVTGHRVFFGSDAVFEGCEQHADAANIPASEATRLLLNRCSGLLLAKELLLKNRLNADESDFIGRNLAKAQLAFGDALLALDGKYHWDCLERSRRLRAFQRAGVPPFFHRVLHQHSAGVRFKLHPCRQQKDLEQFRREHRELTGLALEEWLWIENERLHTGFRDFRQYSFSPVNKCAASGFWRNLGLNLRTFGASAMLDRNAARYPRQRLLNALPLLLSGRLILEEPHTRRHLRNQLHTRAEDWPGLVAAYKRLWNCYG